MSILAIETSTDRGSVAVLENGKLVFEQQFAADRGCGTVLFTVLQEALRSTSSIGELVVGLGPGSYSGVRIAIAAAIGLRFGTRAQMVGIASIAAYAPAHYLAVGDARRESYYFAEVEEGQIKQGPLLLDRGELEARLAASTLPVVGSASLAFVPQLQVSAPSARRLAELAAAGRSIHSAGDLEPIYLRDPHITLPRAK